jgi:hypothetical protein
LTRAKKAIHIDGTAPGHIFMRHEPVLYRGYVVFIQYAPDPICLDSTSGNIVFKKGDIGFTTQVGTVFGSNFKGSSSFGAFVSPAIAYNVSSRFRIKAGVSVSNIYGDPHYAGYDYYSPIISTGTTTSLFVQGDYLLGNKIMLSGAVYKDFSSLNKHVTDPGYKVPESQGVTLNLNYRPTQHIEINASFEYGNGNRSSLQSPFYPWRSDGSAYNLFY